MREGAPFAKCAVRLRNRGADAFQPHVFGDSITIERRINAEGSSGGYKVSNAEGKVVSTKKSMVDAIRQSLSCVAVWA